MDNDALLFLIKSAVSQELAEIKMVHRNLETKLEAMIEQSAQNREKYQKVESIVNSLVKEREAKALIWDNISTNVMSAGIWGLIATVCGMFWYAATQYFEVHK